MTTEVTTIRLPPKDSVIIDQFVDAGEFKSRSDFMRFAIKKTIFELILKEFHDKVAKKGKPTKNEEERVMAELKEIRRELWKKYAKDIS